VPLLGGPMSAGAWEPFREVAAADLLARVRAARAAASKTLSLAGCGYLQIHFARRLFENNRYLVFWHESTSGLLPAGAGPLVRLACLRTDGDAVHDWHDLQRIKNEILGPEARAVEVYPPRSELVDDANLYHLWAWPADVPCPFDLNLPPVTP
jgi:hypothetical protein